MPAGRRSGWRARSDRRSNGRPAISTAGSPTRPISPAGADNGTKCRQILRDAGRDVGQFVAAIYVTLAIDEDASRVGQRINAFLERYYGQPAAVMRKRQACYGGPAAGAAEYLRGFASAGASHIIVRFAGDHERNLETFTKLRSELGW